MSDGVKCGIFIENYDWISHFYMIFIVYEFALNRLVVMEIRGKSFIHMIPLHILVNCDSQTNFRPVLDMLIGSNQF